MTTHKITKTKFYQLNDKRFYFPNAIASLPFGHSVLKELKCIFVMKKKIY